MGKIAKLPFTLVKKTWRGLKWLGSLPMKALRGLANGGKGLASAILSSPKVVGNLFKKASLWGKSALVGLGRLLINPYVLGIAAVGLVAYGVAKLAGWNVEEKAKEFFQWAGEKFTSLKEWFGKKGTQIKEWLFSKFKGLKEWWNSWTLNDVGNSLLKWWHSFYSPDLMGEFKYWFGSKSTKGALNELKEWVWGKGGVKEKFNAFLNDPFGFIAESSKGILTGTGQLLWGVFTGESKSHLGNFIHAAAKGTWEFAKTIGSSIMRYIGEKMVKSDNKIVKQIGFWFLKRGLSGVSEVAVDRYADLLSKKEKFKKWQKGVKKSALDLVTRYENSTKKLLYKYGVSRQKVNYIFSRKTDEEKAKALLSLPEHILRRLSNSRFGFGPQLDYKPFKAGGHRFRAKDVFTDETYNSLIQAKKKDFEKKYTDYTNSLERKRILLHIKEYISKNREKGLTKGEVRVLYNLIDSYKAHGGQFTFPEKVNVITEQGTIETDVNTLYKTIKEKGLVGGVTELYGKVASSQVVQNIKKEMQPAVNTTKKVLYGQNFQNTQNVNIWGSPTSILNKKAVTESDYQIASSMISSLPNNSMLRFEGGCPAKAYTWQGKKVVEYANGMLKIGGTRSWRNNNPGNIVYTPATVRIYGACGGDLPGDAYSKSWRGLIFPSMAAGLAAHRKLLLRVYRNKSIMQLARIYQTGNAQQYAMNLCRYSGLACNRTIGSLNSQEMDRFIKAQIKAEGMKPGTLKKQDGTVIPEDTSGLTTGNYPVSGTVGVAGPSTGSTNPFDELLGKMVGINFGALAQKVANAFGISLGSLGGAPSTGNTGGFANGPMPNTGSITPDARKYLGGYNSNVDISKEPIKLVGSATTGFFKLHPVFQQRVIAFARSFYQKCGQPLVIRSAYRSVAHQTKIFKSHGGNTHMVARPGHSFHNNGLAIDIQNSQGRCLSTGWLRQYGLWRRMSWEPWHIEPVETAQMLRISPDLSTANQTTPANSPVNMNMQGEPGSAFIPSVGNVNLGGVAQNATAPALEEIKAINERVSNIESKVIYGETQKHRPGTFSGVLKPPSP